MTSYRHGGDIYRNRVDYDFSVNTNPLGMPKKSILAARDSVLLSEHYPDADGERLRKMIGAEEGINPDWILLGNGAAELIYAVCHALRPKRGMTLAPSFYEYEAALRSCEAKVEYWDLREEEGFALGSGFLDALERKPDLLFLCNPNNPTGRTIGEGLLREVLYVCREEGICLCLDECFLPFLTDGKERSMTRALADHPNLLILKAFTKIYAMAGLRLGYLLASDPDLFKKIRSCIPPWNTSIPAQMAGVAALQDPQQLYLSQTRKLIARERAYLLGEIGDGLAEYVCPSEANYLLFRGQKDLGERLLEKKILIRSCENYRNLDGRYFRIAVRTHEENEELIRRWREISWQSR